MQKRIGWLLAATAAWLWVASGMVLAADVIGTVKKASGNTSVTRGVDVTTAVAAGDPLYQGDILETGTDGALGMILRDDTTVALGPESRIILDEFVFSPGEGKMALAARFTRGTAAYLSGQIGKLAPEAVRVETPLAILGIRGTHFLIRVASDER